MTAKRLDERELRSRLEQTRAALVVGHIKPDGDDIGSVLAMTEALRNRGVDADVLIADQIADKYLFLNLADEIVQTIPDKDYDMMLFLDLSTMERAGDLPWPKVPLVNIDHHISNPGFADELYLRPEAAATGEILVTLFEDWGWEITPTMAQALYMAIATDCGFFRYGNTTEKTLAAAGKMITLGAKPDIIAMQMESLPKAALTVMSRIMSTLQFEAEDRLSYIVMDEESMAAGKDYVDTYLDLAKNIEGVKLTLQFKYAEPQKTYVSFRSQAPINVSTLAAEFSGGGHIRAAGCTIHENLQTAVQMVIPVAEQWVRDERDY